MILTGSTALWEYNLVVESAMEKFIIKLLLGLVIS
jgi:hypothetical protein